MRLLWTCQMTIGGILRNRATRSQSRLAGHHGACRLLEDRLHLSRQLMLDVKQLGGGLRETDFPFGQPLRTPFKSFQELVERAKDSLGFVGRRLS